MGGQQIALFGALLGLLVATGLVVAIARGGRDRRRSLSAALIAVLALTTVGGVVWARAGSGNSPAAPLDANVSIFTQGFDCSGGEGTCNLPNALYAVRAGAGSVRWEAVAPKATYYVGSGPVVGNGVVYTYFYTSPVDTVGTMDNYQLIAWRARDGAQLWHTRVLASCCEAPLTYVAGDELAILDTWEENRDGQPAWSLLRLRAKDGARIGSTPLPASYFPAVVGDRVFQCLPNGAIIAMRLSDGAQLWRSSTARATAQTFPRCDFTQADGVLYVSIPASSDSTGAVTRTGELLALNATTGQTLWRYATDRPSPLAIGDGLVALGEGSQFAPTTIIALQVSDGTVAWRHEGLRQEALFRGLDPVRTVAIGGGLVVVGGGGYTLWALRVADGSVAWRTGEDQHNFKPLCVVDGVVFVRNIVRGTLSLFPGANTDVTDYITALRASDGAQYWKAPVQTWGTITMGFA